MSLRGRQHHTRWQSCLVLGLTADGPRPGLGTLPAYEVRMGQEQCFVFHQELWGQATRRVLSRQNPEKNPYSIGMQKL